MKYKIAYIDEDDGWLNTFRQTFKNDFEVINIKINSETTEESLFQEILSQNVDAIISDFLLDETEDVDFNGDKVVELIAKYNPYFPIMILTSYEPKAVSQMDNVNIINGKDILDGENQERLDIFKAKIKANIENYYSKIQNTKDRIEFLVKKNNDDSIEPNEEEELTKLFILMDEIDPESKIIPANLIKPEAITKLNEFVNQTKEILNELKKKKK